MPRADAAPPLARIVVAVDPPACAGKRADACGIVAAGLTEDGMIYVLADATVAGLSPTRLGQRKRFRVWRRRLGRCAGCGGEPGRRHGEDRDRAMRILMCR